MPKPDPRIVVYLMKNCDIPGFIRLRNEGLISTTQMNYAIKRQCREALQRLEDALEANPSLLDGLDSHRHVPSRNYMTS